MKRVVVVFGLVVIGLAIAIALRIRAQEEALNGPPGGAGVVEGTTVRVGSRIAGRFQTLAVHEGQTVEPGALLFELDCAAERARLAEAVARLESTRAQHAAAQAQARSVAGNRRATKVSVAAARAREAATSAREASALRESQRLASMGAAASDQSRDLASAQVDSLAHEVEAARAQSEVTRAQILVASAQTDAASEQARAAEAAVLAMEAVRDSARIAVDECTVRAPAGGIVDEVFYEKGELVAPGAVVLTIVDIDVLTATFYLPNAELGQARIGRAATITADAWPDEEFRGEIITVSNEAEFTPRNIQTRTDRDRLVYAIEVTLPNRERKLRPGMPVQVTLLDPSAP